MVGLRRLEIPLKINSKPTLTIVGKNLNIYIIHADISEFDGIQRTYFITLNIENGEIIKI